MQKQKLTITRRTLVRGAIGAGVLAGIVGVNGVVKSKKNTTLTSELAVTPENIVSLDAFTQLDEPSAMMRLRGSFDLPYHSLMWMSDEGILAYLTPTQTGHPLNAVGIVRFGSHSTAAGKLQDIQKPRIVLSQARDNAEGFDIYDVRASQQGIVWLEAHILTNTWRIWCARLTATGIEQPLLLDEGLQSEAMPTIGIVGKQVFWQINVPLRKTKANAHEQSLSVAASASATLAAQTLATTKGTSTAVPETQATGTTSKQADSTQSGVQDGAQHGAGSDIQTGAGSGVQSNIQDSAHDSTHGGASHDQQNTRTQASPTSSQPSVSCIRSAFLPGNTNNAVRCFRESQAGFVASLAISNTFICTAERMQQSRSHTRLMAFDTTGALVDSLVLPAGIRPVNVSYGTSGFTFGIEGSYKNKTGITKLGTYFPLATTAPQASAQNNTSNGISADQTMKTSQASQTSQAASKGANSGKTPANAPENTQHADTSYAAFYNASPWFHFGRMPTTAPCWCDDVVVVKSTYSILVLDVRAKTYVTLPVDSGAEQWGEWCASSGTHGAFATFTSIDDKPIGKEPVRACRVKVWEKA